MMQLVQFLEEVQASSGRIYGSSRSTHSVMGDISDAFRAAGQDPKNLKAWVQLVMAAMEGACRSGNTSFAVSQALHNELTMLSSGKSRPDVSRHLNPEGAPRWTQRDRPSKPVERHDAPLPEGSSQ